LQKIVRNNSKLTSFYFYHDFLLSNSILTVVMSRTQQVSLLPSRINKAYDGKVT